MKKIDKIKALTLIKLIEHLADELDDNHEEEHWPINLINRSQAIRDAAVDFRFELEELPDRLE